MWVMPQWGSRTPLLASALLTGVGLGLTRAHLHTALLASDLMVVLLTRQKGLGPLGTDQTVAL